MLDLLLVWLGDWESVDYRDDARAGIESDCEMRLSMCSGIKGTAEISRTRNLRNTCIFEGKRTTLEVGTVVLWEETGICTTGAAGVQARRERFAEITPGRTNVQQGLAATAKTRRPRETEGGGRALVWRMSP